MDWCAFDLSVSQCAKRCQHTLVCGAASYLRWKIQPVKADSPIQLSSWFEMGLTGLSMLEAICFQPSGMIGNSHQQIDLGALAECLVFYGQVTIVLNPGSFGELVRLCGAEMFSELINEGFLNVEFMNGGYGVRTENAGTKAEVHFPVSYALPSLDLNQVAKKAFAEVTGKSGKGHRMAERIVPKIKRHRLNSNVMQIAQQDFEDVDFLQQSAREIVGYFLPDLPEAKSFFIQLHRVGDSYSVETDLDFLSVNRLLAKRISPELFNLAPAQILSRIVNCRAGLEISAMAQAELATNELESALVGHRLRSVLNRRNKSLEQMELFQRVTLRNGKAIREALNDQPDRFPELLDVLRRGRRFREFVVGLEGPNEELLAAYTEAISKDTWIGSVPAKTFRWAIATGLSVALTGTIGLGVGVAYGFADELILDRLIGGWRPNQFVNGSLKRFIEVNGR